MEQKKKNASKRKKEHPFGGETVVYIVFAVLFLAICGMGLVKNGRLGSHTQNSGVETASPSELNNMTADEVIDSLSDKMPEKLGKVEKLSEYKGLQAEIEKKQTISDENVEDYINTYILPQYTTEDESATPVLDDELAKKIDSNCNSAAEYQESIRNMLQEEADETYESSKTNAVLKLLVEQSEVKPSEEAIEAVTNSVLKSYKNNITSLFGSVESYLNTSSQTYEDLASSCRSQAETYVKQMLVLDEIVSREKLTAMKEDIAQYAEDNGTTEEMLSLNMDEEELNKTVARYMALKLVVNETTFTETE